MSGLLHDKVGKHWSNYNTKIENCYCQTGLSGRSHIEKKEGMHVVEPTVVLRFPPSPDLRLACATTVTRSHVCVRDVNAVAEARCKRQKQAEPVSDVGVWRSQTGGEGVTQSIVSTQNTESHRDQ